ncbi:MAG: aminotransferase class V-fold PLP-dependent enzyme [Clostridia bacterium]|nr:aminotransferase class V-fold PLP-dependent enzyme [Clostridia bacterium]
MIYFDNAATTFPKPKSVIRSTVECIRKYCANPGRSSHALSIFTSEKIYEAREKISEFLGIESPERVVFTQNATHALNLAIKTTVKDGEHVLISDLEHNSVLRPVHAMTEECNVSYSVFDTSNLESSIESLLRPNTRHIVSTAASNVIGRRIDLSLLSDIAKRHSLTLIVDASQLIGHSKIDLKETPCNVLCAPGHKGLYGIQGSGFLVFMDDTPRSPIFHGGSGNESRSKSMPELLPERFEAGTLPSPSVISLIEGINFIEQIGIENIEREISRLTNRCADMIKNIKNTVLYEYGNGIISFNVLGIPSEAVSRELSKHGICTRSGLHCAPLAHRTIGTDGIGTVRISLSYLNKSSQLERFYKALLSICKTA